MALFGTLLISVGVVLLISSRLKTMPGSVTTFGVAMLSAGVALHF